MDKKATTKAAETLAATLPSATVWVADRTDAVRVYVRGIDGAYFDLWSDGHTAEIAVEGEDKIAKGQLRGLRRMYS